jgi:hypothetical protein
MARSVVRRAVDALASEGFAVGECRVPAGGVPTLCFGPGEQRPAGAHVEPTRTEEICKSLFGIAVLAEAVLRSPIQTALSTRERCG